MTHGLGYLEADYLRGIKVHSVFGVSPEGVPLGILHQTHWVRDDAHYGKKAKRRQKRTAAKESQRWLEAQAATLAALPEDQKVVTIADREADLYDFLALPRREGQEFLIRAAQNRVVAPSQKLFETVADWSPTATLELSLGRRDGKPPRTADLSLRYGNVTIQAPTNRAQAHRGPGGFGGERIHTTTWGSTHSLAPLNHPVGEKRGRCCTIFNLVQFSVVD